MDSPTQLPLTKHCMLKQPHAMLAQDFAAALSGHGYGWSLYEPESLGVLKPGSCGYISEDGSWTPLFQIDQPSELAVNGFTSLDTIQKAPPSTRTWGPKISSNMRQRKLELSTGIDFASIGIPADFGVVYAYEAQSEKAGILLAQSPIIKESYYRTEPFKKWMTTNSKAVLARFPEIKDRGMFIVTTVYHTARASTNFESTAGLSLRVGFKVGSVGIGEIAPSTEWARSSHDSGWVDSIAPVGDRKVIIFGGLHFRWHRYRFNRPELVPQVKWRSAERPSDVEVLSTDTGEDEVTSLECKTWGKDPGEAIEVADGDTDEDHDAF